MPRLRDLQGTMRPQEKLLQNGTAALSDPELLAIVLRTGRPGQNVLDLAGEVLLWLRQGHSQQHSAESLTSLPGIGPVKACQILASLELSKRYLGRTERPTLHRSEDILPLTSSIRHSQQEHLMLLTLNTAEELIRDRIISMGTLNASLVHPREVFAPALTDRAHSIVIVHNHPSGNCMPSKEDRKITQHLIEVGEMMGIALKDHLIVTPSSFFSFADQGLIESL